MASAPPQPPEGLAFRFGRHEHVRVLQIMPATGWRVVWESGEAESPGPETVLPVIAFAVCEIARNEGPRDEDGEWERDDWTVESEVRPMVFDRENGFPEPLAAEDYDRLELLPSTTALTLALNPPFDPTEVGAPDAFVTKRVGWS